VKVIFPDVLQSYTGQQRTIELDAADVDALFATLDERYPGLRFRVIDEVNRLRPHIKLFVNGTLTRDLSVELEPDDEVMIVQALSGG